MSSQQRDVIEVLEQDHREVEQMFAELESLRGATSDDAKSRRKDLMEQVTIELVRQSVAEEVLVYPQVESKVSAEEANQAKQEHPRLRRRCSGWKASTRTTPPSTGSSKR
jgi:hemerythrin-like domain-containing protein